MNHSQIPDKWTVKKLQDIGEFSKGTGIAKDEVKDQGLCAVRYGELYTTHNIKIKQIRSYISSDSARLASLINKGDILFAGSGETIDEIGKSATYLFDDECYAGGDIVILRPDINNDSLYLAYLLNSPIARKVLRKYGQGQSVVHVYKKDLEQLPITIPEKEEQRRIVGVLEVWDEYLEKLDKKIELKKNIKKGLMQQLLTGKKRLPGFSGEWASKILEKVCKISTGKKDVNEGNPNGDYPFFTCSRNHTYSDSFSYDFEAILIAGNADVGYCMYYFGKFEAYQRTYILNDFKYIEGRYLFYFMNHFFKSRVESMKQIGAMSYIKLPMLKEFVVSLPSNNEQLAIISVLDAAENELKLLMLTKELTLKHKKYLVNNLVTGKICTPVELKMPELEAQHA